MGGPASHVWGSEITNVVFIVVNTPNLKNIRIWSEDLANLGKGFRKGELNKESTNASG